MPNSLRWFYADVETTGVKATDQVCEICWKELDADFNEVDCGYSLINPLIPIPPGASGVNGITDAMVANAPTLTEYMESAGHPLLQKNLVFVAHSASFDYRFLKDFINPDAQVLCTLKCARTIYPDAENHKLQTLRYMLALEGNHDRAHTADEDVAVLIQLVKRMCRDADCGLAELLHIQNIPRKITHLKFGKKHYGKPLAEVPKSYIEWMLKEVTNLDPDLRAALLAL